MVNLIQYRIRPDTSSSLDREIQRLVLISFQYVLRHIAERCWDVEVLSGCVYIIVYRIIIVYHVISCREEERKQRNKSDDVEEVKDCFVQKGLLVW